MPDIPVDNLPVNPTPTGDAEVLFLNDVGGTPVLQRTSLSSGSGITEINGDTGPVVTLAPSDVNAVPSAGLDQNLDGAGFSITNLDTVQTNQVNGKYDSLGLTAGALALDISERMAAEVLFDDNGTITVSNSLATADSYFVCLLQCKQDATGGRTGTFAGVNVWATKDGLPPTLSTDPNAVDYITLVGAGVTIIGIVGIDTSDFVEKASVPVSFIVPVTGDDEALTSGINKREFRMPSAMTLTEVRAHVKTSSSSGDITIDINQGGTSILSTKLTIDANEDSSVSAAVPAVILTSALNDDAEITIDIDAEGTGATGLKVVFKGTESV